MAKEILGLIKLQIPAGGANPSPPVGPALGQRGLNIMDFCKAFNEKTKDLEKGSPIPVIITGIGAPFSSSLVFSLNALQKSIIFNPL